MLDLEGKKIQIECRIDISIKYTKLKRISKRIDDLLFLLTFFSMMQKQFLVYFLVLLFLACHSNGQQASSPAHNAAQVEQTENRPPSRRDLYSAFRQMKKVTIVYGTQQADQIEHYQNLLKSLPNNLGEIDVEIKQDTQLTQSDISSKIIYLIGTFKSNLWIQKLADQLPITFNEKGFSFAGQQYVDDNHIFKLDFFPNPLNEQLPLLLATGNSDASIIQSLTQSWSNNNNFLRSRWGYEISRKGEREVLGSFADRDWTFNENTHWRFHGGKDSTIFSKHFRFIVHDKKIDLDAVQKMATACEATVQEIQNFMGTTKPLPTIEYHLYSSVERKGLMHNNTDHAHVNFDQHEVHALFNEAYADNFIQKENELILHHWLGEPQLEALHRGLAIHFTKKWQRQSYSYWSAKLAHSNNALSLNILFNKEAFQRESPLVTGCLSATLIDFLLAQWGKEKLLNNYLTWLPSESEITALEPLWQQHLSQLPKPPPSKAFAKQLPYLKGFNFAHEGYQIYNGYTSDLAVVSLNQMADINSNAMAIVPYSFMRDPNQPSWLHIKHGPGGENDEGVVHSLHSAKQLGMTTVLKPQIWIRRAWPGDVKMKSEADWQTFFENYHSWMRHYAMLAEIHEVDLLSIGVEFAKATLSREKDWRALIHKIRGIYSGPLTYSANWGDEFENLHFWDALDYIGLNCYYPLSKKNSPSKREMKSKWKSIVGKIEKVYSTYKKPIIFTEIGFRSVDQPWKNPHEHANGRAFNESDQKLCYEIVFEGIKGKRWCHGILWWKWPSYLHYRGEQNTGFTPNNKITEEVIAEWFGKL